MNFGKLEIKLSVKVDYIDPHSVYITLLRRKEGRREGRKEGGKEGMKEGRREGRKEGRRKPLKNHVILYFQHCLLCIMFTPHISANMSCLCWPELL